MTIALAAAGMLVALVAAVLILADRGSSSSTHTVDASLRVGTVQGPLHGTHVVLAGLQDGSPVDGGGVTVDLQLHPGAGATAQVFRRGGWLCFPVTQEHLIHCAPPGYLQRGAPDVPLFVFDKDGKAYLGPEDLIRNDVYRGQRCPSEGGGPYHKTPNGYVACHQFPFAAALRGVVRGTAKQASVSGWFCFPITAEGLIHCAPPGYLQRNAADVPLLVFDTNGLVVLGPEDLIRNNAYHGQKCPFEGGGPYHKTPQGYVACHQFPLNLRAAAASGAMDFTAKLVDRVDKGTLIGIAQGTMAPGANASVAYKGTGRYTGGTGSYSGAKGSFRLSGTIGADGTGTFTLSGTVKY